MYIYIIYIYIQMSIDPSNKESIKKKCRESYQNLSEEEKNKYYYEQRQTDIFSY